MTTVASHLNVVQTFFDAWLGGNVGDSRPFRGNARLDGPAIGGEQGAS